MSLNKTYRLQCDAAALILQTKRDQLPTHLTCYGRSIAASDPGKARRAATKNGWVRHREELPLLPDKPDAGSSVQAFDLCPNCAKVLVEQPVQ